MRFVACLALFLSACASGGSTLHVDLVTDLCPDVEGGPRCLEERFDTIVVSFGRGLTVAREVRSEDAFLDGQRVAELRGLDPGDYVLTVELLSDGTRIAQTSRPITIADAVHAAQVVIQSECARVRCPMQGGDPSATECVSGGCVDPRCFTPGGGGASCGALCEVGADCAPSVPCAEARCIEQVCIELLRDERCAVGERCIGELGCFGGVLEGDPCESADDCGETDFICCGGECRQPDCDDGNPCTDDACRREGCVNEPIAAACDDGVHCNGADSCEAGACTVHAGDPCAAGTVCDEAGGACVSCLSDADCPTRTEVPIDSCSGFVDFCDESGAQTWRVTTYACVAQACVPASADEARACTRARTGLACGAGDSACGGDACRCGGAICRADQYCSGGLCWDWPRFEPFGDPSPTCVDATRGPNPGNLLGYRVYGRPGARVHKYNRHASCAGAPWFEGSETASAPVYLDASGLYELVIDTTEPLPCDFAQMGRFESYVEVDGIRVPSVGTVEQTFYNPSAACSPGMQTCAAARSYCP